MEKIKDFLYNADVWINVHIFKGNEGETISSRVGRKIERYDSCLWCRIFCRLVLFPLSLVLMLFGNQKTFKHCREFIQKEYKQ